MVVSLGVPIFRVLRYNEHVFCDDIKKKKIHSQYAVLQVRNGVKDNLGIIVHISA